MSEVSFLWTTGGAGDGANTYTRSDWASIARIIAAVNASEGVAPNGLNALAGTVTGANTVSINTGYAIVDGKPYINDAAEEVNIPSAVGVGNTRIDRIVLRADWSAQTVRITRIAGSDAITPASPSITQNSGTTYDITLYRATVNTSGTVTLTDERTFGQTQTNGIADDAVTTAKIADSAVDTTQLADDAVTQAKIDNSAVGTAQLIDANVTLAKMASNSVDTSQIVAQAVTSDKIDTQAINPNHLGDGPMALTDIQGGSATDWATPGSSDFEHNTRVQVETGSRSITILNAARTASATITYPLSFTGTPVVFVSTQNSLYAAAATTVTASTVTITVFLTDNSTVAGNTPITVFWLAIGPKA